MKECIILTVIFKDIVWLNVEAEKKRNLLFLPPILEVSD